MLNDNFITLIKTLINKEVEDTIAKKGIIFNKDELDSLVNRIWNKFEETNKIVGLENIEEKIGKEYIYNDLYNDLVISSSEGCGVYNDKKGDWAHKYENWDQFENFRAFKKLPKSVMKSIDRDTNNILSQLHKPDINYSPQTDEEKEKVTQYGLVMGLVQAGKTTNYSALIDKAMDVGYSIIIIFAGDTVTLRNQTQIRIEEDCVGKSTIHPIEKVGIKSHPRNYDIEIITKRCHSSDKKDEGDATNITIQKEFDLNKRYIFVCKKNLYNIKKVIEWVSEQQNMYDKEEGKFDSRISMLLLCDETDQSSIDTIRKSEEASKVNSALRSLFNMFVKKSYIGYTATPFANIFTDIDSINKDRFGLDFFPRHFIYYLEPASNYVGADEFFGENRYPFVEQIESFEDKSKDILKKITEDISNKILPKSLEDALNRFFLIGAIRSLRGFGEEHNSMLINIKHTKKMHNDIQVVVSEYVETLRNDIINNNYERIREFDNQIIKIYSDIKDTTKDVKNIDLIKFKNRNETSLEYNLDFDDYSILDSVKNYLLEKDDNDNYKVKIMKINSDSDDKLDYNNCKNGLHVIAIGGLTLARGLTLKGLVVSYYLRTSKQVDTQLQSCRWFGYPENNYRDLIKLYTTFDINKKLEQSNDINNDLVNQLKYMSENNRKPSEYRLYIKNYEKLKPTGPKKIGSAKCSQIKFVYKDELFNGEILDVGTFSKKSTDEVENFESLERLIESLGEPHKSYDSAYTWTGVKPEIIAEFVGNFRICDDSRFKKTLESIKIIEHTSSIQKINEKDEDENIVERTKVIYDKVITKEDVVKSIRSKKMNSIDVVIFNNNSDKEISEKCIINNLEIYTSNRNICENDKETNLSYQLNGGRCLTDRHLQYILKDDGKEGELKAKFNDDLPPGITNVQEIRTRNDGFILIYLMNKNNISNSSKEKYTPYKNPIGFYLVFPGENHHKKSMVYENKSIRI